MLSMDLALVGDAREALRALIDVLKRRRAVPAPERQQWLQRIESWRGEHPLTYDPYANTVKPQQVIESIGQRAAEDAIVAVDVGQHQMWTAQFYNFLRPRTWLCSSGLGSMGYGFSCCLGCADGLSGAPSPLPLWATADSR